MEFTDCGEKLVLLDIEKTPFLICGEVKRSIHGGPPKRIKSPLAVPLKDLWVIGA